jgi:hypothetical protein
MAFSYQKCLAPDEDGENVLRLLSRKYLLCYLLHAFRFVLDEKSALANLDLPTYCAITTYP